MALPVNFFKLKLLEITSHLSKEQNKETEKKELRKPRLCEEKYNPLNKIAKSSYSVHSI
jgi:hypothetical protein